MHDKNEEMRIVAISYGNYEYDGRLVELLKVLRKTGKVYGITRGNADSKPLFENHILYRKTGRSSYFSFIIDAVRLALRQERIDILFADNRKAVIPALLIMLLKKPRYVVQDMRELYLIKEVRHTSGKIGCRIEQKLIKRADMIICANEERRELVKELFAHRGKIITYENIRRLEYSADAQPRLLEEKYGNLVKGDEFKIISTSGADIARGNHILVKALADIDDKVSVLLVGGGSQNDINTINKIIDDNSLTNVHILGTVNQDELKYLVSNCDCGVVNYGKMDTNNRYCASGKLYEFIFEGKPVIVTDNVPLVNFCEKYKLGCVAGDYREAIVHLMSEMDYYRENVKKLRDSLNVDDNNDELASEILESYKEKNR